MNAMNKAKPYLFWIVLGAVVLIELIVAALAVPTDNNGRTPPEVKQALDAESGNLQSLHQRAKKGEPTREFDPRIEGDIKELTEEYIITPQWTDGVNACVRSYEKMLADIRDYLIKCSGPLALRVWDSQDLATWMDKYGELADKLVKSVKEARVVSAAESDPQLLVTLGLFDIKGGITAQTDQHKDLTAQFRIVDQIAQIVMKTRGKATANPVAADKSDKPEEDPADAGLATIVKLEWTPAEAEELSGKVGQYAVRYHLTLSLSGTEPALMSVLAAIESIEAPVYIVAGATMSRPDNLSAGAKRTTVPIAMKLDISVLDFNKAADPAAAPAGGAP